MNRYNFHQSIGYLGLIIVMLFSPIMDFHPATIPLAAISSPARACARSEFEWHDYSAGLDGRRRSR